MSLYPKRPPFFAQRVTRLMFKTCAANEIGVDAVALVACIAAVEDAKRYRGGVTYHNGQLMPLLGMTRWERFDGARKAAVRAGWLHYTPPPKGGRGPGVYWSLIPDGLESVSDGPTDEDVDVLALAYKQGYLDGKAGVPPKAYTETGYGSGRPYPENGDGSVYGSGDGSVYGSVQHSYPIPFPNTSCPNSGSSDAPNSGNGKKPTFTADDRAVAEHLWTTIKAMQPDRKEPKLDKWANTIRLMRETDKRTHQQIRDLFGKVNRDEFWRTNILSPDKLREKWDDLALRLKNGKPVGKSADELYKDL